MANILYRFCVTALESKSTKLWLKGPGGLVSMEPSIVCDSYGCYIVTIHCQQLFVFQCSTFSCWQLRSLLFQRRKWLQRFWAVFFLSASCSLQDMTQLFSCQQHILSLVCAVDSLDWISCQWHLLSIWSSFWKLNVLLKEAMWYLSRIVLEYLNWGIQGESGLKHLQQNV